MTRIEWTDVTWNPIRGCSPVSPGCENCYAARHARRMAGHGGAYDGLVTSTGKWTGDVRFVANKLDEPLHWREPRRVFVNSMSDLFHNGFDDQQIAEVFAVMRACPRHTFQIATKRIERFLDLMSAPHGQCGYFEDLVEQASDDLAGRMQWCHADGDQSWPLSNLHLIVSCEDQHRAEERIPKLLMCPAAVRGVRLEPLLEPVDLSFYLRETKTIHLRMDIAGAIRNKMFHGFTEKGRPVRPMDVEADLRRRLAAGERVFQMCDCPEFDPQTGCPDIVNPALDWVIVGPETGPHRRECKLEWIESIVEQSISSEVPVFVKAIPIDGKVSKNPEEWPKHLRVRMFPGERWSP